MPTAAERQAVAFLATVAVLGGGVRLLQAYSFDRALAAADAPAAAAAITAQLEAVDSARRVKANSRSRAITAEDPPIDPDVATEADLVRLPRVGPALARRIVADRDSLGPFGSLEALQRVKGIGPALAAGLTPYVTFSSGFRPSHNTSPQRHAP
jgi:competence protein ComEA